jgi:hypothetical protein
VASFFNSEKSEIGLPAKADKRDGERRKGGEGWREEKIRERRGWRRNEWGGIDERGWTEKSEGKRGMKRRKDRER